MYSCKEQPLLFYDMRSSFSILYILILDNQLSELQDYREVYTLICDNLRGG